MTATPATPSPQTLNLRDATLKASDALPAGASTTVDGTVIDLGTLTGISGRFERLEALISAPALTTTMLPDTKTMTYSLMASAASTKGTPTTIAGSIIVQTGASTAGAAAATARCKLPTNCPRYLFLRSVSGANVTDSSSKKQTLELLF